jgi:predicted RNA-binding Zn ribbon-like protein
MTAGDLAVVLASMLCTLGFAALIVVLLRVLDTLRSLRSEVEHLREETRPLLAELRSTVTEARDDLDRFDRVLGSAEAISDAVSAGSRVARVALSAPVIKTVALATGTGRAGRRLRRGTDNTPTRRAR